MQAPDPIIAQLIDARHEQGMSYRQLQAVSALSISFVCEVEQGKHSVSLQHLRRWAAALGYDVTLAPREPASGGVVEPSPLTAEEATHESFTELPCDRDLGPHPRHTWSHKGEPCEGHVCPGERLTASLTRRRHDPGALMEEPDLHPKTFDPEDERRADDAHMAAMEAQMEHDAEQGEGGAR